MYCCPQCGFASYKWAVMRDHAPLCISGWTFSKKSKGVKPAGMKAADARAQFCGDARSHLVQTHTLVVQNEHSVSVSEYYAYRTEVRSSQRRRRAEVAELAVLAEFAEPIERNPADVPTEAEASESES